MCRALSMLGVFALVAVLAGIGWYVWLREVPLPPPPPWTDDMQAVATGNNQFAFDLYGKLREAPGNLFFSPYSAHTALAMTATGAKGNTRDQMVKVLHLPTEDGKLLASGDLGQYYAHPRKDYKLSVANALWGQKNDPWRPDFVDQQKQQFGAGFREADFKADPNAERQIINTWAEEQTRGKIKGLIQEGVLTSDTRMVLANAIYFKGEWAKRFDPDKTRDQTFTLADGKQVQVPMMKRKGGFKLYSEYGKNDEGTHEIQFQVGEIPYKGDELSMVVLLPGKPDGLPVLEAKLSADALAGWLRQAHEEKELDLGLPKFRLETNVMQLKEPLKQLGMLDAFDLASADFSGMQSGTEKLCLTFVLQKAFVDVNEVGTEAAAVTVAVAAKASEPLEFIANRPFLFLIRDVKRGTILFIGRVMNPSG